MKIDYKKILNINKNTVKKYVNKPLFNNNYLYVFIKIYIDKTRYNDN
mgnify:CR=1 FL=1